MSVQTADASLSTLSTPEHLFAATDPAAFEALYAATCRPLLAYLRGVTGHPDIAEDLLQETFCRFLVRRPSAMPLDETRRYLFRIATNLLRDRWRHHEDPPPADPPEPTVSSDPTANLEVQRLLTTLKPRERELLWLAYVEGMTHSEIAAVTGLAALSVRLLLFRARKHAAHLLRPLQELP